MESLTKFISIEQVNLFIKNTLIQFFTYFFIILETVRWYSSEVNEISTTVAYFNGKHVQR